MTTRLLLFVVLILEGCKNHKSLAGPVDEKRAPIEGAQQLAKDLIWAANADGEKVYVSSCAVLEEPSHMVIQYGWKLCVANKDSPVIQPGSFPTFAVDDVLTDSDYRLRWSNGTSWQTDEECAKCHF